MPASCECHRCTPQPEAPPSAESQYSELIPLSFVVALVVYHGARAIRKAYLSSCCSRPVLAATHEAPEEAPDHQSGEPLADGMEPQQHIHTVNKAVEAKRLERARLAARHVAIVFTAAFLLRVVARIVYLWSEKFGDKPDWWNLTPFVYAAFMATVGDAVPWCIKPRMIDVAYVGYMMLLIIPVYLQRDCEVEYLRIATWIACGRLLGGALSGVSVHLVAVMNGILSAATIAVLHKPLGRDVFLSRVIEQLAICVTVVTICNYVESALLAEVKSAVEARTSSQAETTVRSLLSAMCDAVVYVGQHFQIQRPAPRLALLLLMRNTMGHLQGSRITDLMPEADSVRFREIAEDKKANARSLNVHLRNEYGSLVGVRLFLARCPTNGDGEDCVLVGVSVDEEPGFDHVPEPPEPQNTGVVSARIQQLFVQRPISVASGSGRSAQHRSNRSHASDQSLALHDAEGDEAAVWIDPADVTMPVVSCTAGFTVVCGPASTDFSLLKAIADTDSFRGWFQHSYNARVLEQVYEADLATDQQAPEPLDMILLPHRSSPKSIGMSATCTLSELVEVDGRMIVKLDFDNLCQVSIVRKGGEKKRKGRVRDAHPTELPPPSHVITSAAPLEISL